MADATGAVACPLCGQALNLSGPVSRKDVCPGCGRDLRACHACRLHAPTAHNECREPRAEWQARRDRSNYCDFFELAPAPGADATAADPREAERQQKLNDLFRNF
ncbi:MAG: hypothetical protein OEW11_07270 [Nitrospirota bacterium]|nr:hypothetical protein [Nitrospirota bacterium]